MASPRLWDSRARGVPGSGQKGLARLEVSRRREREYPAYYRFVSKGLRIRRRCKGKRLIALPSHSSGLFHAFGRSGETSHQSNDGSPRSGIGDLPESAVQLCPILAAQEIDDMLAVLLPDKPLRPLAVRDRDPLVEELDGYSQHFRQVEQAARSDAVDALLVFLDLLGGNVEPISELGSAHAEKHPARANAAADMHVNGVCVAGTSIGVTSHCGNFGCFRHVPPMPNDPWQGSTFSLS